MVLASLPADLSGRDNFSVPLLVCGPSSGFWLLRIQVLSGAIVPGFVLSAYAVDAVLRSKIHLTIGSGTWLLLPLAGEVIVALTVWRQTALLPLAVGATLLLMIGLLVAIFWRSVPVFLGVAVLSIVGYWTTFDPQPAALDIHRSSLLVEALKNKRVWLASLSPIPG